MIDLIQLSAEFRARPVDGYVNLAGYDPTDTPLVESKSDAKDELDDMQEELFDAHELLYAEKERSVMLVLQGLDCSGKNGTIKHVVIAMNPAGVRTTSFKAPTKEEKKQHFLERHRPAVPEPGQLGVFDRSYYEDVIVPAALEAEAEAIFAEIDELGGVVEGIEAGYFQAQIAASARRFQDEMETDQRRVVGVNAFVEEDEHEIEILRIDESAGVGQRARLERLREERDQGAVDRALVGLEAAAREDQNLMPPILDAARAYATLGEIRHTLEGVYGRFKEPVGF